MSQLVAACSCTAARRGSSAPTDLKSGLHAHYFTNGFNPKVMRFSYTERPAASCSRNSLPMVLFGFEGQRCLLLETKVVLLRAWQTNQSVAPLWHLSSNSRSTPMEFFQYGQNLPA